MITRINAPSGNHFTAVIGGAGSRKTLLTYDITKYLIVLGKKDLLVHCGNLNEGHNTLIQNGWKNIGSVNVNDYNVIFIDEIQRIRLYQFNDSIEKIKTSTCKYIFSYDNL